MSATENQLIKNLKTSGILLSISVGIGYLSKKMMKTNLTSDPTTSFMNFGQWVLVLTSSLYAKDYLEKNKIIPS